MLRLGNLVEQLHAKYLQSQHLHYRQGIKTLKTGHLSGIGRFCNSFSAVFEYFKLDNLTTPKMLVESKSLKIQIRREYQWEPFDLTLLIIDEMSKTNKINPITRERTMKYSYQTYQGGQVLVRIRSSGTTTVLKPIKCIQGKLVLHALAYLCN